MFKHIQKKLTILIVICFLFGCKPSDLSSDITPEELLSRIADNTSPIILDVRSAKEFAESHVPGAINIPYDEFSGFDKALNIEKKDEIIVYCESGKRAEIMINKLKASGFFEVRHLDGDMQAWRKVSL